MSLESALARFRERNRNLWLSRGSNTRLWDVTLTCSDGTEIVCCRKDLSVMSEYFERMFNGSFAESESSVIEISSVDGSILRRMIAYFYEQRVSPGLMIDASYVQCPKGDSIWRG